MPTTTAHTLETLPLSLTNPVAAMARLRGVGRSYQHQRDTSPNRFVGEELPELEEGPTVRTSPLSLVPGLLIGAFTNASQVLKGNAHALSFGLLDKSKTNRVVDVCLESPFSATEPFLKLTTTPSSASCAFCGSVLQSRTGTGIAVTDLLQLLSIKVLSSRCVGNVSSAQVNPQTISWGQWFGRFRFDLNLNMVSAIIALNQGCRSWFQAFQQVSLIVADRQRALLPAIQHRQANTPIFCSKSKDPSIVVNACWIETFRQCLFDSGCLAVGANTGNRSNGQIRRQPEQSPNRVVDDLLNCRPIRHLRRSFKIDPSASIRKSLECCINFLHLFGRGVELTGYRQHLVHAHIITHPQRINTEDKQWNSLKKPSSRTGLLPNFSVTRGLGVGLHPRGPIASALGQGLGHELKNYALKVFFVNHLLMR